MSANLIQTHLSDTISWSYISKWNMRNVMLNINMPCWTIAFWNLGYIIYTTPKEAIGHFILTVPVSPDLWQSEKVCGPADLVCVLCEERLCCHQTSLTHPHESIHVCNFSILEKCVRLTLNTLGFNHWDSEEGRGDAYSHLLWLHHARQVSQTHAMQGLSQSQCLWITCLLNVGTAHVHLLCT